MAFALLYRTAPESSNKVTGVVSFLLDFATVLFAPAVTRWGMFIAVTQGYFLVRLFYVLIRAIFTKSFDWKLMIS